MPSWRVKQRECERDRETVSERKREIEEKWRRGVDKEQTTPTLPFSQDLAVNELIFHPASAVNDWHFPHAERGPLKSGPSDRAPFIFTWREHRTTGHNAMPRHAARRTLTCVWTRTQRGTTGTAGETRTDWQGCYRWVQLHWNKRESVQEAATSCFSRKNQSFILL